MNLTPEEVRAAARRIMDYDPGPKASFEEGARWAESMFRNELPAGTVYLDPPDGGEVSVIEQVRRMAVDAKKWREFEAVKQRMLKPPAQTTLAAAVEPDPSERSKASAFVETVGKGGCVRFMASDGRELHRFVCEGWIGYEHPQGNLRLNVPKFFMAEAPSYLLVENAAGEVCMKHTFLEPKPLEPGQVYWWMP